MKNMSNALARLKVVGGQVVGRACQVSGVILGAGAATATVHAQATDISSAITEISTYETAGLVIGVAILLWTVGRMVVHKVTRG